MVIHLEHHEKTNVNLDLPPLEHKPKSPGFDVSLPNSPKSRERLKYIERETQIEREREREMGLRV